MYQSGCLREDVHERDAPRDALPREEGRHRNHRGAAVLELNEAVAAVFLLRGGCFHSEDVKAKVSRLLSSLTPPVVYDERSKSQKGLG